MKTSRIAACAGLVALAATLITVEVADAGGRGRSGRRAGTAEGHGGPGQALNLTEDQQAQLQALRQQGHAEAEALHESGGADRGAFKALRESHRVQFQAILTDEQRDQLETLRAEWEANRPEGGDRPRGHHRRGPGGAGERPDLGATLGLSEDQSTQIKALRTDLRSQLEALRESGEGSREQAQELIAAQREQMQSILTDEQRTQLETLRAEREANRPEGGHRGRGHHRRGPGGDEDTGTETETEAAAKTNSVETRSWGSVKSGR
jgi:Spy/CpxP family protein refolding chaperone